MSCHHEERLWGFDAYVPRVGCSSVSNEHSAEAESEVRQVISAYPCWRCGLPTTVTCSTYMGGPVYRLAIDCIARVGWLHEQIELPCLLPKPLSSMSLHLVRDGIGVAGWIPNHMLRCVWLTLSNLTLEMCPLAEAKLYERSMS